MARRLLVTGAKGFVGRHLLGLLAREEPDAAVFAWHRPATLTSAQDVQGSGREDHGRAVTWVAVDALDRRGVTAALGAARPEQIYHLAGLSNVGQSWADPAGALDANVVGTHVLLEAMRRERLEARLLIPGSATVYAPAAAPLAEESAIAPASPYALSKLAQELLGLRAVRDDAQEVVVARAFNHVGPGQHPAFFASSFARQLAAIERGLAPPVLRVGNLEARRDLTDVRDTVRAYRLLMQGGTAGRVYNVCSGRAWRIGEVLDRLIARCRVPVRVEADTARLRPNDAPVVVGSAARLQQETGWIPRIGLDQTLGDLLDEARGAMAESVAGGSEALPPTSRQRPDSAHT